MMTSATTLPMLIKMQLQNRKTKVKRGHKITNDEKHNHK